MDDMVIKLEAALKYQGFNIPPPSSISDVGSSSSPNQRYSKLPSSSGERTVKKLKMSKALTIPEGTTVLDACRRMAARRVDAVILTDTDALLSGIVTDKFNAHAKRKFRHLPVVENGEVIAILDIAKCLYDAISRMEKIAVVEGVEGQWGNNFTGTPKDRTFAIVVATDPVSVATKRMQELKVDYVIIMAGNNIQGILTSKDLLMRVVAHNLPAELTFVGKVMTPNPEYATVDTTILEALRIMYDGRFLHLPVVDKAADVSNMVMQKLWDSALNLDLPNDYDDSHSGERTLKKLRLSKALTISEKTSVLDACRRMAARRVDAVLLTNDNALLSGIVTGKKMVQGKFRHLPVVENGEVIAILDIAKCLYDAISRMEKTAKEGGASVAAMGGMERQWGNNFTDPVSVAAKRMQELKVNSVIIMAENNIQGILTSKDLLMRVVALILVCCSSKDLLMRVVAQNLPPELTFVEKVMTPKPEYATVDTTILEALHIMHDGKFLHLPVVDKDGSVVACVDVLQITDVAISMIVFQAENVANTMTQKFWGSALK
ncbi:hypothetical protein L1887_07600 [Cichorium endivia]|nr:hypothetical protein L1887_07600 [Cichorium endivia]